MQSSVKGDGLKNVMEFFYARQRPSMYGSYRPSFSKERAGAIHRAVYWADNPIGGIGVSFVDPVCTVLFDEDGHPYDDYKGYYKSGSNEFCQFQKGNADVLLIGDCSDNSFGRQLTEHSMKPFVEKGVMEHWRECFDSQGHGCSEILVAWTRSHMQSNYEDDVDEFGFPARHMYSYRVHDETIWNDYTNRVFNYFYIRKLIQNDNLFSKVKQYGYFTDGCRVNRRFGYWSPAYAIALCLSLERHGLLKAAMTRYSSFVRYHPVADPIVALSEIWCHNHYSGLYMRTDGPDPVLERKRVAEQEEVERREREEPERQIAEEQDCLERSYDDDLDEPCYVDDCPVYGADDEEDAEITYWNAH